MRLGASIHFTWKIFCYNEGHLTRLKSYIFGVKLVYPQTDCFHQSNFSGKKLFLFKIYFGRSYRIRQYFHQPHKTNHKIKTLHFSYGYIIWEFVTIIKKNHSIFTLKAKYKPQLKNCKLFISSVCNFWLRNNLTKSFLYLHIIWTKLPE